MITLSDQHHDLDTRSSNDRLTLPCTAAAVDRTGSRVSLPSGALKAAPAQRHAAATAMPVPPARPTKEESMIPNTEPPRPYQPLWATNSTTSAPQWICPDLLSIRQIGTADGWRGRLVRIFFTVLQKITGV